MNVTREEKYNGKLVAEAWLLSPGNSIISGETGQQILTTQNFICSMNIYSTLS
jgi:hypothetical protein